MAKETAIKKRKASAPEADIEKVKKVKSSITSDSPPKKRKAAEEATSAVVKKTKTPKATAAAPQPKTSKKSDAAIATPADADAAPTSISKASKKKVNTTKAALKKVKQVLPSDFDESADEDAAEAVAESDAASDVDDQTEALLKGFESEDEDEKVEEAGLEEGQPIPAVPKLSKADKKLLKTKAEEEEKPGVVYVGRIPHGFYEYEMREYFKQFGNILKLRLSRNRKTGASRHYAFVQFESVTVADIVARTMDNYLLFGHILKVKTVSEEQLSPEIWKGANKRFKKVPWNKLEGRRLNQGVSEDVWEKRNAREEKRRADKQAKLKAMDYEFEQPKLKSAKGVAKPSALTNGEAVVLAIEDVQVDEPVEELKANEDVVEQVKTKGKKVKAVKVVEEIEVEAASTEAPRTLRTRKQTLEVTETPAGESTANQKTKKTKTVITETAASNENGVEKPKKAKKVRKSM